MFEVPFEGQPRLFQIVGFGPTGNDPAQKLAEDISGLSVQDISWNHLIQSAAEVDWDTQIEVVEETKVKPLTLQLTF